MKNRLLEKLAGAFPYLVLFTYIAGIVFSLLIDRMSYLINGSILAIPAVIASVAFIFIKKKDIDLSGKAGVFRYTPAISVMVFLLLFTLTILTFLITPVESRWGFVAVLFLYGAIFVQILSRRLLPAVVLGEAMLTLAATIYSYTLRSALYFGATDTMPHIYMSTITYLSGHIIPGELGTYTFFPLYHIFVALSSYLLGLDIQTALFITTALAYCATVLFLYYISNGIFHNEQVSLLVVLAYIMNASVIYYGAYMVTRTLSYVGFMLILFLLYTLATVKPDAEYAITRPTALRAFVVVGVIFVLLTHQISTPMIVILLGLISGLELIARDRRYVNLVFLIVPVALLAYYWVFVAYSFMWELLPHAQPSLYETVVFANVESLGLDFLINRIDMLLIIFFALVGAIYLVWKQQPKYSIIFGILGLIAVFLNVPNFLTAVFQFVAILRMDRFALLFLPFLAVVMGAGIYVLTRYLSTLKMPLKLAGLLVLLLVMLYGVGSLGIVKSELESKRYSFDEEEIVGFNHVLETVPSGSALYSEYYTSRYFFMQKFNASDQLGLPYYTTYWVTDTLDTSAEDGYIVIPNGQFLRSGLLFGKDDEFDPENLQPYPPTQTNIQNISRRLSIEDKIYSNYNVEVYRSLR